MANSGSPEPPEVGGSNERQQSIIAVRKGGTVATEAESAAGLLLKALHARSTEEREAFASGGLARLRHEEEDRELEALLLRQLYLAQMEREEFFLALETANEMIELETLGDVARQDAARAALGLGEIEAAAGHLRIAARVGPASRQPFHLATLGALLRFAGKMDEAIAAFDRAVRIATGDRPFYQAQLALAQLVAGEPPHYRMLELRQHLESDEAPQNGYRLWILGEICAELGDDEACRNYLTRFLAKMTDAPRAKLLALSGEVAHAEALLERISSPRS